MSKPHTKEELAAFIEDVLANTPLKGTELMQRLVDYKPSTATQMREAMDVAYEMAKQGKILEIEYVLPLMGYRTKSMFFPKGTKIIYPKTEE